MKSPGQIVYEAQAAFLHTGDGAEGEADPPWAELAPRYQQGYERGAAAVLDEFGSGVPTIPGLTGKFVVTLIGTTTPVTIDADECRVEGEWVNFYRQGEEVDSLRGELLARIQRISC